MPGTTFIARPRPERDKRECTLGTKGVIVGTYKSRGAFIQYALRPNARENVTYSVYVVSNGKHTLLGVWESGKELRQ